MQGTHRRVATADSVLFDGTTPIPEFTQRFGDSTAVLISIPPDGKECPVLQHHLHDLQQWPALQWVGYLSTTGVYGDWQGEWVNEESPLRAATPRTKARVAAEDAWRGSGLPVHIFRLAGIYGPHRNALEDVKAGTTRSIHKDGQVFSRIHVEDIAHTLATSLEKPHPGRIYNVCDHLPTPPAAPIHYACELLGIAPPPLIPWEQAGLSPMGLSFYQECKRVRNSRLVEELGVVLRYPTYKEGLDSLYSTMENSA